MSKLRSASRASDSLPATEDITDLKKFIQETIDEQTIIFTKMIEKLEEKVVTLEQAVESKQAKIDKLEFDLGIVRACNKQLNLAHDSLAQYGRRFHCRIENVPHAAGETNDSLKTEIVKIMQKVGANVSANDIIRHHRSSKLKDGNSNGRQYQYSQCIVKLNNWKAREELHHARKTARTNGNTFKPDLTKNRLDLLARALSEIERWNLPQTVQIFSYA